VKSTNPLNIKDLPNLLLRIYNQEDVSFLLDQINQFQIKYSKDIASKERSFSEKDVVLITYGDNIQKKGQKHLTTLYQFINQYCCPEINSVHILPFYPYTSDDGFSVKDYFEVDKNLGSWEDIKELSETTHLMFDAVVNHISKSSSWFEYYLADNQEYQDFFIDVDPNLDFSKVVRPRALPLLSEFKDINGNIKNIWTTFSRDQVDLNYASPRVFIAVLEVLLFYISKGAKYIRLDAIAFIWKEVGTTCIHLEQVHLIIQAYRKIIEHFTQDVLIITETNVPHDENISYFGNGYNEAQMVYNFTLPPLLAYSVMKENVNVLTQWAHSLQLPSSEVCFFNFTASHDGIGVRPLQGIINNEEILSLAKHAEHHRGKVSYKNNEDGSQSPYELNCSYINLLSHPDEDDEFKIAKMMLTQSVMLAMPGIPGIYIHSLLGSENYYKGVEESGINRRINREKLDFELIKTKLKDAKSIRNRIFKSYKHLLQIRIKNKAFNPVASASYKSYNNCVFSIERNLKSEKVICLHNFSGKPQIVFHNEGSVNDLLTGELIASDQWRLAPFEFKWLKPIK
jgi:glycosidase